VKVHAPFEQAGDACATLVVHATGDPHAPPAAHVSTPVPEHVVCVGAHTPEQPPLEQVWLTQADAPLHVPSGWQVSTALPEHIVAPGAHTPLHVPGETQAWLTHAAAFDQVPLVLHVCGCWPLHCV
jgi:hypothetical protein